MKNEKTVILAADCINGVYEVDEIGEKGTYWEDIQDFIDELPVLDESEIMYCVVKKDDSAYDKINSEYGIN